MPAGVFFRLLSVYEQWREVNRLHIILWRKYPLLARLKLNGAMADKFNSSPAEAAGYLNHTIEANRNSPPFPIFVIILNTLMMLFIAPFWALSGLFYGPLHVMKTLMEERARARYGEK